MLGIALGAAADSFKATTKENAERRRAEEEHRYQLEQRENQRRLQNFVQSFQPGMEVDRAFNINTAVRDMFAPVQETVAAQSARPRTAIEAAGGAIRRGLGRLTGRGEQTASTPAAAPAGLPIQPGMTAPRQASPVPTDIREGGDATVLTPPPEDAVAEVTAEAPRLPATRRLSEAEFYTGLATAFGAAGDMRGYAETLSKATTAATQELSRSLMAAAASGDPKLMETAAEAAGVDVDISVDDKGVYTIRSPDQPDAPLWTGANPAEYINGQLMPVLMDNPADMFDAWMKTMQYRTDNEQFDRRMTIEEQNLANDRARIAIAGGQLGLENRKYNQTLQDRRDLQAAARTLRDPRATATQRADAASRIESLTGELGTLIEQTQLDEMGEGLVTTGRRFRGEQPPSLGVVNVRPTQGGR